MIADTDSPASYLESAYSYTYDPRDRVTEVTRAPAAGATHVEQYRYDANDNVISKTIDGTTTNSTFDRNRLQATETGGVAAQLNYDPFGRLDTITSGGQVAQRYVYDGFDRIVERRGGEGPVTTRYAYDSLDRTISRLDRAGTASEKTTEFGYLDTSRRVVTEHVDGALDRTYQYTPWGERLSMVAFPGSGPPESSYYSYNPHRDVIAITDEVGDTRATYGYTAYGSPDTDLFTGVDKPDPGDSEQEPYNIYRFNAMPVDPGSGEYDMGARQYSPSLNRFLTRDGYHGAGSDLNLATNPWTLNRYTFTGGNPINRYEVNGKCWEGFLSGVCENVEEWAGDRFGDFLEWSQDVVLAGPPSRNAPFGTPPDSLGDVATEALECNQPVAAACNTLGGTEAVHELGDIIGDLTGINDLFACGQGELSGCAWLFATVVSAPLGAGAAAGAAKAVSLLARALPKVADPAVDLVRRLWRKAPNRPVNAPAAEPARGEDLLKPGPWARESIPATGPESTAGQRELIQAIGDRYGCHSCGAASPGGKAWVFDHQPPTQTALRGVSRVGYPHCRTCSDLQAQAVRSWQRRTGIYHQ